MEIGMNFALCSKDTIVWHFDGIIQKSRYKTLSMENGKE